MTDISTEEIIYIGGVTPDNINDWMQALQMHGIAFNVITALNVNGRSFRRRIVLKQKSVNLIKVRKTVEVLQLINK